MARIKKIYKDSKLEVKLKSVAERLAHFREVIGISQSELSRRSGVATSTINEIENKTVTDVRLSTLSAICNGLELSLEELFIEKETEISERDYAVLRKASSVLDRMCSHRKKSK